MKYSEMSRFFLPGKHAGEPEGGMYFCDAAAAMLCIPTESLLHGLFARARGMPCSVSLGDPATPGYGSPARRLAPQFVCSPIPIPSWPFCFTIQTYLGNYPGALAQFLRVLADDGIALLSCNAHLNGYEDSNFSATAEFVDVDPDLRNFLSRVHNAPSEDIDDMRMEAYRRLGQYMAGRLSRLSAKVLQRDLELQDSTMDHRARQLITWAKLVTEHGPKQLLNYLSRRAMIDGTRPWSLNANDFEQILESLCDQDIDPTDASTDESEDLGALLAKRPFRLPPDSPLSDRSIIAFLRSIAKQTDNDGVPTGWAMDVQRFVAGSRYAEDGFRRDFVQHVLRDQWAFPFSCRAIRALADAYLWRFPIPQRHLRYARFPEGVPERGLFGGVLGGLGDGKHAKKRGKQQGIHSASTLIDDLNSLIPPNERGTTAPFTADDLVIISADPDGRFARLRFSRKAYAERHAFLVNVHYQADVNSKSTRGLMECIARQCADFKVNIERIHDSTRLNDLGHEHGEIWLFLELPATTNSASAQHLKQLLVEGIDGAFKTFSSSRDIRFLNVGVISPPLFDDRNAWRQA